jgi:hypothetical protein
LNLPLQIVISASRRTDIPAFYMDWFMEQVKKGSFEVVNPYNRKVSRIQATPDRVHTIVFWSKNFGPFIDGGFGTKLSAMGYNLFFNFTINSHSALLEPHVPPLNQRLSQLRNLCREFDPKTINWRFDPICFLKLDGEDVKDNLKDFSRISNRAHKCGVSRCITSFMDHYPKIRKRTNALPEFSFADFPLNEKVRILLEIETALSQKNIDLYTCCEKEIMEALPSESNIKKSSCIPNDLFVKIFGGNLCLNKDSGQRTKDGCECRVSVDIGSYHLHPCYHNCLFCYANPTRPPVGKRVDP